MPTGIAGLVYDAPVSASTLRRCTMKRLAITVGLTVVVDTASGEMADTHSPLDNPLAAA